MRDLWTKWHWNMFFSEHFEFPITNIPQLPHMHSRINWRMDKELVRGQVPLKHILTPSTINNHRFTTTFDTKVSGGYTVLTRYRYEALLLPKHLGKNEERM
jgi:hypothetical protein